MAGKVLNLFNYIQTPDRLASAIAIQWHTWNSLRRTAINEWEEIRRYVFATDTTTTTNSKLPWKNKTTYPKMCQIHDNLHANYMLSMFPKRKFFTWLADDEDGNSFEKRYFIISYMRHATNQYTFKNEVGKCVTDYILTGNAFIMPEWTDERVQLQDRQQVGYVGPSLRRISPFDIVFNPIAPSFYTSPKIIRSLITMGELKELLSRMSTDDNQKEYEEMFKYLKGLRVNARQTQVEIDTKDTYLNIDGFTSWRQYLESDYVEVLTFYGDIYDYEADVFLKNHVITVIDRHKIVGKRPNPSYFGYPPIFQVSWRKRPDNLWGMSPLANLVGMQYRIDHVENMKADVLDAIGFPMWKIKGYVEDFDQGPGERIHVGDEGDVEAIMPPYQVLQLDNEIGFYTQSMEEMSGSPKEAMGFRTPGEKTAFEVQRLENAAARIFQNKVSQFEEQLLEPAMNSMLEMARRQISNVISIPVIDEELGVTSFVELTAADITGAGKLKPMAARHFAEKAEVVQSLTNFLSSQVGQDQGVRVHFSGIKIAKLYEEMLDITDYKLVMPYIRISEEADAQSMVHQTQEDMQMKAMTPSGLTPDDYDPNVDQQHMAQKQALQGQPQQAQGQPNVAQARR